MLFDLIVIGSGPAGNRAALQSAQAGKKVALIEDCPVLGGGCTHSGTLPSKSFRESVYRWALGPRGEAPRMKKLTERRDRVVPFESQSLMDQLKKYGVALYSGRGKILSSNDVEVISKKGTEKLTASFIFIATGAHPVAPEHLKVDGKRVLDSDTILEISEIPKSLVILGAGIIGCEYASTFATAGAKVYLIDRRHEILAAVDREIVGHLTERFEAQGIEILLETEALKIDRGVVTLSNDRKIKADAVLIAQGRNGNTKNLGLESVGIEADERGLIPVDGNFRTVVPSIYAMGDVIGPPAQASTAMEEGRIAACHAFGIRGEDGRTEGMPTLFPYGIYTIPEISMIGATEEELIARKLDYVAGKAFYRDLARGRISEEGGGLLKLLIDRKTLGLLGVHIVGDHAAELIHIGQAVMHFGGDVNYFIHTVFNYPTVAEAYKTASFHAINQIKSAER